MNEFIDIGPGGSVAHRRVVSIGRWDSTPIRRAVNQARKEGRLIDLTYGRACRWVYFLDSGHVVLGTKSVLGSEESEKKE
jgi:regulator of extracellular matrix RemA (YlzA/DUF370 family)